MAGTYFTVRLPLVFLDFFKYTHAELGARRRNSTLLHKGGVTLTKQAIRMLAVALVLALSFVHSGHSQVLMRHVAEFRFGPEQVSVNTAGPLGAGGDLIYFKTFNLPAGEDTVFITLSSTGDTHGGAASWFSALVNGVVCNRGNEGAGFAPAKSRTASAPRSQA